MWGEFLKLFEEYLIWLLPLFLLAGLWLLWARFEWKIHGNLADPAYERRIQWLCNESWGNFYKTLLERLLNTIEHLFGSLGSTKSYSPLTKLFKCQPFTVQSYVVCFLLSAFYPIFFALLAWGLGGDGRLGEEGLFPEWSIWARVLSILILLLALWMFNQNSNLFSIISIGLLLSVSSAFTYAESSATFSFACAIIAYFSIAAVSGATSFVAAILVTFFAAAAVSISIADAIAVDFVGSGIGFISVLCAAAAVTLGVFVASFIFKTKSGGGGYWLIISLFFLCYLLGALWLVIEFGALERQTSVLSILLFLGFLPLSNAVVDWLSLGVTRGLLHAIHSRHHHGWLALCWAVLDVLLATVFLLLVFVSTLAMVLLANTISQTASGPPVLDLIDVWLKLKAGTWQDGLWVYLLLFSTLIPTVIHFIVASLALFFWLPHSWLQEKATAMQQALKAYQVADDKSSICVDSDARLLAFLYRTVTPVLAIAVSGMLILFVSIGLVNTAPAAIEWLLGQMGVMLAVHLS